MTLVRSLFLLLLLNAAHATWDPEYCLPDEDISVLEDSQFKKIKEETVDSLKDTWCSAEKVQLMMDLVCVTRPNVCVEIGAHSGSSVLPVAITLAYLQNGTVIAIDAWSNAVATRYMSYDDPNRLWWSTVNMEWVYRSFLEKISRYPLGNYCNVVRASSEDAVLFLDEIDFLHLDGDYTEKGALDDVRLYLPKVKTGGYILLSNLFVMVKGKAPKMKAFSELFDACEMVCEIDRDNVVLFRKN